MLNIVLVRYTGGVLLEGGSDTTAAFLQWLILCLTAFPEVQNRAHKDIDQIVGSDRSPRIEDFDSLPYIGAIIKEVGNQGYPHCRFTDGLQVHRFRPVLPTGIPHAAMADEVVCPLVLLDCSRFKLTRLTSHLTIGRWLYRPKRQYNNYERL